MNVFARVVLLIGLTALLACGGAPPGEAASPAGGAVPTNPDSEHALAGAAPGAGAAPVMATDPAVDLSPVAPPGETIVHVRWRRPAATVATLGAFAGLPVGMQQAGVRSALREIIGDALGSVVDSAAFAEAVNLDAPVDFIVMVPLSRSNAVPKPMQAFALGLTSVQAALGAAKGKSQKVAAGLWRLASERSWGPHCVIASSSGSAVARLICADSRGDVERLAPYMARNLAAAASLPSDLRLSLHLRRLLDHFGPKWSRQLRGLKMLADELKLGEPRFDSAVSEAATALVAEAGALIKDLDTIVIDASVDPRRGLEMALRVRFAGQRAWSVATLAEQAKYAKAAPPLLWRLPKNSESFSYNWGGDSARFEPVLKTMRVLLTGALKQKKIGTAGDRRALAALLRVSPKKGQAVVYGSGSFAPSGVAASNLSEIMKQVYGWRVYGFDQDSGFMRSYLRDLVKVVNRPTLVQALKKAIADPEASKVLSSISVRNRPAPAQLGRGAMAVEIVVRGLDDELAYKFKPKAKAKKVDLKVHILLMQDGSRSWLGVATERDQLATVMAGLKRKPASADGLGSRSELRRFRTEKHLGAAGTSVNGLLGSIKPLMLSAANTAGGSGHGKKVSKIIEQVLSLFERLPHQGTAPITFVTDATGRARPSLAVTANVPREAMQDLGFLIMNAVTMIQQAP